jgi:hypothetical protein
VLHAAFEYLLIAVLVAAVISFVVMGLAKVRRSRSLARAAHQRGNRFFRDDPFDVPRRYAKFALISSGHSPCAHNVTDGRLGGRSARAFDFRCELGHGTRRITRHYSVLVVGAAECPHRLLMWSDADASPGGTGKGTSAGGPTPARTNWPPRPPGPAPTWRKSERASSFATACSCWPPRHDNPPWPTPWTRTVPWR